VAHTACANNGLTLIGTGAESVAMGGADVAVARDTTALNSNPAGLGQLAGWALDGYLAAAYAVDIAHSDRFGNDREVSNVLAPVMGGGISKRIDGAGLTVGMGTFATAGAGNVYNDLQTPVGGTDTLRAQFGVLKFVPGVAWQATEAVSLGVAMNVYYSSLTQRNFPNTSQFDPNDSTRTFFGTEISNASTVRLGVKGGILYKHSPSLSVGMTYSPQLDLPFDNGRLRVNYSALGLGTVTYRNVKLRGLALPEEIAVGIAIHPQADLLLAFDVQWSNYRRALRSQTLFASDPDDPRAPATVENSAALNWHNQTVFAAGLACAPDDSTRLYAGINFGRNPIPPSTLNPLLATIGEWHFTGGLQRRLDDHWNITAGLEYLLPKKVTYDNPQLPFGPGARERVSYVGLNVMLSRRW
jgi:long-chain fatty acid transport protein